MFKTTKPRFIRNDKYCPNCGEGDTITIIDQKIKTKLFGTVSIITYQCTECRYIYEKKFSS